MKSAADLLLCAMQPRTYYRVRDIAEISEMPASTVRAALMQLAQGGVIDMVKEPRRNVFITRQMALFI